MKDRPLTSYFPIYKLFHHFSYSIFWVYFSNLFFFLGFLSAHLHTFLPLSPLSYYKNRIPKINCLFITIEISWCNIAKWTLAINANIFIYLNIAISSNNSFPSSCEKFQNRKRKWNFLFNFFSACCWRSFFCISK